MRFLSSILAVACCLEIALGQNDFNQPQSPAKPAPTGLKFVDQGKSDPRLKGYQLPDGFRLEIVAEEPTVINPVGMTFGPDGSLYVLEWTPETGPSQQVSETTTYKDGSKRSFAVMKKSTKDVVKKLSYDSTTGRFINATVILEDELPSSILIHDGWLYTSGRGTVRRWKLAEIQDGKHKSAPPEIIAQGFCGFHHHQVSGLTIGNDGLLYITSGDDDNYVEGSDGSRATVLRTGAIFRCRPDGSKMEIFSIGYRNPYRDLAFDRHFNAFHVDNDNEDGSKFTGCRLMHVPEESDFGWRLKVGARCCQPDPVRGAVGGELPGKMAPLLKTGRGAPAGLLIYNDAGWPDYFRDQLLYPDVFRKSVRAYRVTAVDSTFAVNQEYEFLKSDDPLFRPCQMISGPDGAVYVADWRTDSGGAGRLSGDGKHGRIYRITWTGGLLPDTAEEVPAIACRGMDSWSKIISLDDEALIKSLGSESLSDRRVAQHELVRRGAKNRDALRKLLAEAASGFDARAAALGVLESQWNAEVQKTVLDLFDDVDGDLKRLAIEALARHGSPKDEAITTVLIKMLGEHDHVLRRASALAIGRLNPPGIADQLIINVKSDKAGDPFLFDGYLRALERLGKPGVSALVDLMRSGNASDRDRSVALFLGGRSREMLTALPDLLLDPHVTSEQRAAIISSATNYQFDPSASLANLVEAFGKIAKPTSEELAALINVLGETNNLSGAPAIQLTELALKSELAETRVAAIKAIEKSKVTELAPALLKALQEKSREVPERIDLLKTLRTLNPTGLSEAVQGLFQSDPPATLRAEAMRTLAAIDPMAVIPLATRSLETADTALQTEAVQLLGASPAGAKLVGQRFLDKKLPRELLPQISEALRKHASKDPVINQLLIDVLKGGLLVSLQPAEVEKVRQLVLTKGDASRGRNIYLNTPALACVTCHKMEGVGGQVGPDLTRLWDTSSIEKLIESMLDPSKEIKEGYQSYRLVTKKGGTHSGLKITDTADAITIREASGIDIRVPKNEVDELSVSKVSLMPDNVVSQLSFEQFVDLVAFLKNRQVQESLRGIVTEYTLLQNGKSTILSAQPNGILNLRTQFPKGDHTATVQFSVHSPQAQEVAFILGVDGKAQLSINEQTTLEFNSSRPFNIDNERVRLKLSEGWNTIKINVSNRNDLFRFSLRLQGNDLKLKSGVESK